MRTQWHDEGHELQVVAPVSLIISAFAPVTDVRNHFTPELKRIQESSRLLLLDLGEGKERLGGSVLAQVYKLTGGFAPDIELPVNLKIFFEGVQCLLSQNLVLAYHDRSDGGHHQSDHDRLIPNSARVGIARPQKRFSNSQVILYRVQIHQ